jgi:hypothetical protein
MGRKKEEQTTPVRITSRNVTRLWSLAGRLQDKAGRKITLDETIDYLFKEVEGKQNES